MDGEYCVRAWERALAAGNRAPTSRTATKGHKFTSEVFSESVESAGGQVSMDGRGRWIDNRMIERFWRNVKYKGICLRDYADGRELGRGLSRWFREYGELRPHQSLGNACPAEVYSDPAAHGAKNNR